MGGFSINLPGPLSAGDVEKQSPLWPLQSAMRGIFTGAVNSGAATNEQAARVGGVYNDVEHWFGQWQKIAPVRLRAIIRAIVTPPALDLANDPVLSGFQDALLSLSHWEDSLPS